MEISGNDVDMVKVLVQVSHINKKNLKGGKLGNRWKSIREILSRYL